MSRPFPEIASFYLQPRTLTNYSFVDAFCIGFRGKEGGKEKWKVRERGREKEAEKGRRKREMRERGRSMRSRRTRKKRSLS